MSDLESDIGSIGFQVKPPRGTKHKVTREDAPEEEKKDTPKIRSTQSPQKALDAFWARCESEHPGKGWAGLEFTPRV